MGVYDMKVGDFVIISSPEISVDRLKGKIARIIGDDGTDVYNYKLKFLQKVEHLRDYEKIFSERELKRIPIKDADKLWIYMI